METQSASHESQALQIPASTLEPIEQATLLHKHINNHVCFSRWAMREGLLGWTKARTVAGVATPETDAEWVEFARQHNSRELEARAWDCRRGDGPPEDEDEVDPFNYVWASIRLDAVHFEQLMRALTSVRQRYDDPNISASQLLMIMAERELQEPCGDDVEQTDETQSQRGENAYNENYRIIEHRCPECEQAWAETRRGKMLLDDETRAMIECDAQVIDGDTGHLSRTIPPATRRAVLIRDDGKCQVPGCGCRKNVELHHLKLYSEGGSHRPENLVTVCWAHHEMLHRDVIHLQRARDGSINVTRLAGEPLGIKVSIFRDRAELENHYMEEFEGPAGSWCCLGEYFGEEMVEQARAAAAELVHVYHQKISPRERYSGGRTRFVAGDA